MDPLINTQPATPRLIAAVDLGSNSFRMELAQVVEGRILPQEVLKETVRLEAGLDAGKMLSEAACQHALAALSRFSQRLQGLPPQSVRIVGTSALRVARNANSLLKEAEQVLGYPVEIISGEEEARLIYVGVSRSLDNRPGCHLVVDIGGGSTEVILGDQAGPRIMQSLPIGCVNLALRFFANGKLQQESFEAARQDALAMIAPIARSYRNTGFTEAVGSSGTIKAIFQILGANGFNEVAISATGLAKLKRFLIDAGHVDNLLLDGLKEERRSLLPGGFVILEALFEALCIKTMGYSNDALREGILHELMLRS